MRRAWRGLNLVASLAVVGALVFSCVAGIGPLPALGLTFNPGTGLWTAAEEARPWSQTPQLFGLDAPARVVLDRAGVPHVTAASDHDLFLVLGYLHARDRLFEMDLMRRQAEGRLAEVLGRAALSQDQLQLDLGLLRTAEAEWSQLPATSPARAAIEAYAWGVNQRIQEAQATAHLPLLFKLLGYQPQPWRPVDTMVLRGVLAEDLAYQTEPLLAARLERSLGPDLVRQWLPVLAPNEQAPYDPGPYRAPGSGTRTLQAQEQPVRASQAMSESQDKGLAAVLQRIPYSPHSQVYGASNNWAVDGTRSASGRPLMASDPHLGLTLPAVWYQVSLESPGYQVAGVTIPGAPAVLIGRNRHISWGATDTQAQATLFYQEQTDAAHPGHYLWRGEWLPFVRVAYDIPVRGAAPVHHVVQLTRHGPVLTQEGQTLAVQWVADEPAPASFDSLLGMMRAPDWHSFTEALRPWVGPIQNWVYADDAGHIGLIAPGRYPLVASGDPWLPLSGTGESDVVGFIPFDEVPRSFDPPQHFVVSANQRPVGPGYPYYIGTTLDSFDPGYRASEIVDQLSRPALLSVADMVRIQLDDRDRLALRLLPRLLDALQAGPLTTKQAAARDLLAGWDGRMDVGSAAATVWNEFRDAYLETVFQPWWDARHVPISYRRVSTPLLEDLEAWTLHDPGNPAFTPPGAAARDARVAMVQAFQHAVDLLASRLGSDPATWRWGRVHHRAIPSLARIKSLGYGPVASAGNAFTPNAAPGDPSTHGPSWRLVVDWGAGSAYGIYPGGQSENPASPHYQDQVPDWLAGRLRPMLWADTAGRQDGAVTWWLPPRRLVGMA